MNKAITDGVHFMPSAFANGLDVWSSGDGTPGSDTYDNATNAAFVPADQDFAGALELEKTQATQKLRHMGQTPILPGCYLRVTARVKAISGNLPAVRIAGYPARANGSKINGVNTYGAATALTNYGEVVEVSAIIGTGNRNGVDMVWGADAAYGHFGLDLTGQSGGIVRIDDIVIEDITSAFIRDMIAQVDVRDYGARGDGTTNDAGAFQAANAAANGRTVLVPKGHYRLNSSVTFDTPVKFEGRVSAATGAILLLRRNFDLPSYIEAFENEEVAFLKAFQALINNADHESLDMGGRKVNVTKPLDMAAAVPNKSSYATRRVIRNGQLEAASSTSWNTDVVTSQATYSTSNPLQLRNVVNIANVPVGALVQGGGVGREIYVRSKNIATQEITLNAPLYDAAGTQNFTFRRFKYLLDFSGFNSLSKLVLDDVEFQCNNRCSAINLAPAGLIFHIRDCFISRPRDRGITSIGTGCSGMLIDRCNFLSAEDSLNVSQRKTIGLNSNGNDVKLRDNRATRFRHFALLGGANNIVTGNHFFQGDNVNDGTRSAGLIIASTHASTIVSSNYVDNCFIDWTNEQDHAPEFNTEHSFSAVSITENIFLCNDVAPWFSFIVVKPHGAGHFISGVNITGNKFRSLNGTINRAERVDTSFAGLDYGRCKNIVMKGNSYHGIIQQVSNSAEIKHQQLTAASTWVIDTSSHLPFDGRAAAVDSVVANGPIRTASNAVQFNMPYVKLAQGANQDQVHLIWPTSVKGQVAVLARMDNR